MATDVGYDVEQKFGNMRAEFLHKPASGDIIVVEVDARSLHALNHWPWPRDYYAEAVRKLDQAGANLIAFDIDFSTHSTRSQDQSFEKAIAESEATIVLPTLRQPLSSLQSRYIETRPIEPFRQHAVLASGNLNPDGHGQFNQYNYTVMGEVLERPSLASAITGKSGAITGSFAIDHSIDPTSIPRISFLDLMGEGPVRQNIAGKKILIGPTAMELEDRYPTKRFGMMPGVVIHAMASETLVQETDLHDFGRLPGLLIAATVLLIFIFMHKKSPQNMLKIAVVTSSILLVLLLAAEYLRLFTYSNIVGLFILAFYMVLQKFLMTNKALETSQYIDELSGLPNEAAFLKTIAAKDFGYIATARIRDFREMLVVSNAASRLDLFKNLANRLSFLARAEEIYHVDSDMIAWIVKKDYADDIPGYFDIASAMLQAPVMAKETRIKIGVTFGISDDSIDKAKIASELAFADGKKWTWYDQEVDRAIGEKLELLVELDLAIEEGNLDVVYQPKWNLEANCLDGAEALVRWTHPERGPLSPEIFIPILEQAGRIDLLTYSVLQQSLDDLASWSERRPGLTCSVNISAKLLCDTEFVDKAIAMVEASPVDNSQVVFEVTETAALAEPERSVFTLKLIRNSGIRVSIDDYGTGQSTMSYLQRLPVSEIKLDQSFVKTMIVNNVNRVMVQSTIKMAHALGLKIVAEGIEDQPCMDLLTRFGCDIGQGWYISRPVTTEAFTEIWLDGDYEEARLSA